MRKKWRAMFRENLKEDADRIIEEVNKDPSVQGVEAPDEIHAKLMQQIREYEGEASAQDERLTAEEKRLIRLGRFHEKTRVWYRYGIAGMALITVLSVGITSFGGPQKVMQVVREWVNERERTKVNVDEERIEGEKAKSEYEAYIKIKDIFDCEVVELYYLPKQLKFVESNLDERMQRGTLYHEGEKEQLLMYNIWFNYRTASTGVDVEDELLQEYTMDVDGQNILIKQYLVEGVDDSRWRAEFEHQKVHYFIVMSGMNQKEVEKIVKNLKFY